MLPDASRSHAPPYGRTSRALASLGSVLALLAWSLGALAQPPEGGLPQAAAPLPDATSALPQPSAVPTAPASTPRVALLPISHAGVDAVVPRRVGEAIAAVLTELGYSFADPNTVARSYAVLRPTDPPLAADVFRATLMSSATRGVHIRVGVVEGSYFADLLIASADGSGPFRAHVVGGPNDFLERCAQAIRATMPPPSRYDEQAAARYAAQAQAMAARPPSAVFAPATFTPRYRTATVESGPRLGISFVTDSAFGRSGTSRFYNHTLGVRFDVRLGRNVVLGLFTGYVNLDRGSQRGSNILSYVQLEDRLRFAATGRVQFPLRFGFGYLPLNGPFIRLAGGIRFPLGEKLEMGLDLVAPTIWWIPGGRRATYDMAAELTYRFGPGN